MFPRTYILFATIVSITTCLTPLTHAKNKSPLNPPEFYEKTRQERYKRIGEVREKMDPQANPRYRTERSETADYIIVKRETWKLHWSKKNGILDQVDIIDVTCNRGCQLSNLEVTDTSGTIYRQSNSSDARIKIDDKKFHLVLVVEFSPVSDTGKKFPATFQVEYDLFKLGSLITVRYSVVDPGDGVKVTHLVVRNSIGKVDEPLKYMSLPHMRDNEGHFYAMPHKIIESWKDRLLYSGRIAYSLFTNGRIGYEICARRETYNQGIFEDPTDAGNLVQVGIADGNPVTDIVYINHKKGVSLERQHVFDLLISFLPFRKFQPKVGFIATPTPGIETHPWSVTSERDIREIASWGGQEYVSSLIFNYHPTIPYVAHSLSAEEAQKRVNLVEIPKKYGMRTMVFTAVNLRLHPEYQESEHLLTDEEWKEATSEPWAYQTGSFETEAFRSYWLNGITSLMTHYGLGGVYLDLNWCYVAEPEMTPQIEGGVRFYEDLRLLVDSYGNDKIILIHSGEEVTPLEAMGDTMYPGEPHGSKNLTALHPAHYETAWNPFLTGCQVIAYDTQSYDFESPTINKQFFRNAVIPIQRYAGLSNEYLGEYTPAARANMWRLYLPLVDFDIRNTDFHHWRDVDARDTIQTDLEGLCLNIYNRPEKGIMVAGARLAHDIAESSARIHVARLGITTPEVFAYDILTKKLDILKVQDGWVTIECRNMKVDPVMVFLKAKHGEAPVVVWTSYNLEMTGFEDKTFHGRNKSELREDSKRGPWEVGKVFLSYKFKVRPESGQNQSILMYCGDLGFPASVGGPPVHVDEYLSEARSIVISVRCYPLGKHAFKRWTQPYDGPASYEQKTEIRWGKIYQLGFPDVSTED